MQKSKRTTFRDMWFFKGYWVLGYYNKDIISVKQKTTKVCKKHLTFVVKIS